MTIPQKHDYIGLSERRVVKRISDNGGSSVLNLKETELRLGLPGSESPKRTSGSGVSFFGNDFKVEAMNGFSHAPLKNYGSGAKRRFCDVIKSCGTWSLSVNGRCETDLGKSDHDMFSTSGVNGVSVKDEVSKNSSQDKKNEHAIAAAPASVVQVVGWPPVRSFRKNTLATTLHKNGCIVTAMSGLGCLYVKVSMDGAPYLRKVDLNTYCNYSQLSSGLENMFSCFTIGQYGHGFSEKEHLSESRLIDLLHGSEYVLTYEDKDGDWMLVGDVPWELFIDSCKRLRIMKGSDAIGLAPRTMQKFKSQN